jgi:thiol-disulfide isomerase/thioredoxin
MKSICLILFLLLWMAWPIPTVSAQSKATIVDLAALQNVIQGSDSGVRVINFWATWCGPCVKELPLLEKLGQDRKDVQVTLVSLDLDLDPNPEKVHKFVQRKKILSTVLILDAGNPNDWIDKIDKRWGGSLPATLVVNGKTGKRAFIDHELHDGELEKMITEVQ